jgi:hypothetical protein
MFLLLFVGVPPAIRAASIHQLALIHELTPNHWLIVSLLALSALAIFLRIKLG